tara:strand:- start:3315 stop:5312 length:1998 start_codon:yes stop_codon:yes gene_type:complete
MASSLEQYRQELVRRGLPNDLINQMVKRQGQGLERLFQEEGIGRGPLDYRGDSLSDLIREERELFENNPFNLVFPGGKKTLDRNIKDLREDAEYTVQKELLPKGLGAALQQIRENQKSGLTPIIRDEDGGIIGGGNPLFKSPEADLSSLVKKNLRKKASDRITAMPSESLALQESGLDELADQLRPIPISGPKSDESSIVTVEGPASKKTTEKKEDRTAEEFRADEEKIAGMTGGDPVIGETKQSILDNSFSEAMDDYINAVRGTSPEDKERTLDEYKAEFAEATGIDISGKVDKSSALMAFGLALMQNRAGSGFNVGKMLSAIGEAGEKALPALEKAKEKAQSAAIAAGKYALETRASDRAKDEAADLAGKKRGKYWVYKKGGKGTEFANFDEGEFVDLNPFELNKLIENKDFASQYEFIDASDRMSILEKRAEGVELGDMWDDYKAVSLIGGSPDDVPPELQIFAAAADPNYGGLTPTRYKIGETPETIVRRFTSYQAGLNRSEANMKELVSLMEQGVSLPKQFFDNVGTFARNLGIEVGDGPMSTTKARTLLKEIAVRQATNILQESGKTLSDRDRKLVDELVGEINWNSGDKDLILGKIKKIYYLTVVKPQENLNEAVKWLQDNAGISFSRENYGNAPASEEELAAFNEATGNNFTMEDFK